MSKVSSVTVQILALCMLTASAGSALCQPGYPTRAIRVIVPYPPGGSNDVLARLFGPKLSERLGQQILVDNRGGGNTIIGSEVVAKSPPDGYTLLLAGSTQVALPHLYRDIPYDTINDFAPVAGIARSEFLLVVHPSLPANDVRQFIALAKARPGQLNYASSSTGGPTHLGAVLFEMIAGVKMQQIPYKGGGPAIADLMAGQVQLGFGNPANVVSHVQSGRLKAIAVTGEKRLATLPQVPTFAEAGLPGLVLRNWYAILAPAGTPKGVIDKLSTETGRIAAMPEIGDALVKRGLDSWFATPDQLDAVRKEDMAIVAKVIKAANIKIGD